VLIDSHGGVGGAALINPERLVAASLRARPPLGRVSTIGWAVLMGVAATFAQ